MIVHEIDRLDALLKSLLLFRQEDRARYGINPFFRSLNVLWLSFYLSA